MSENKLNGVTVIAKSIHDQDTSVLKNKIKRLNRIIHKIKNQHKIDEMALNRIKEIYPKQYWEIVQSLKEEYAVIGRLVSEPNGLTNTYGKVLKRDNNKCVRCRAFGKLVNTMGSLSHNHLSIDHIHEKSDGGSSDIDNLQTLCHPCHMMKTRLSIELRNYIMIDKRKAHIVNKRFLESYNSFTSRKSARNGLLKTFGIEVHKSMKFLQN